MIRPIEMTDTMAVFTRLVDPLDTRVELAAKERLERELAVLIFAEPLVVELFLRGRVCRPSRTGLPIDTEGIASRNDSLSTRYCWYSTHDRLNSWSTFDLVQRSMRRSMRRSIRRPIAVDVCAIND